MITTSIIIFLIFILRYFTVDEIRIEQIVTIQFALEKYHAL